MKSWSVAGTEGLLAANSVQRKCSSGHPRTVGILGKALPTTPSEGDLHWDTYREMQKKQRSEDQCCPDT